MPSHLKYPSSAPVLLSIKHQRDSGNLPDRTSPVYPWLSWHVCTVHLTLRSTSKTELGSWELQMMWEYFSDSLNVIKAHRLNKDLPRECCVIMMMGWEPKEKTGLRRENKREKKMWIGWIILLITCHMFCVCFHKNIVQHNCFQHW